MKNKKGTRIKHIPQRTCVGCREVLAKKNLIRIVKTAEGIKVDPSGKAVGRGAYIHEQKSCWERALKGALSHALRMELSENDRQTLIGFMEKTLENPSTNEIVENGDNKNPKNP